MIPMTMRLMFAAALLGAAMAERSIISASRKGSRTLC
jgi:hypothetical protein